MKLPSRPLTNYDLINYIKKLKIHNFRGVFMRDDLPRKIHRNECGIVNLDSRRGEGTHWTAYVKHCNEIIFFNSYGNLRPSLELVKYFLSDGSNNIIKFNYDSVQSFSSYKCRHYCLLFLYNQYV